MPFSPTQHQYELLRALEYLQANGCPSADAKGKPTSPKIGFELGVPEVMLKAWILVDRNPFRSATQPMLRRELIVRKPSNAWVSLWGRHRFALPDGRVLTLECQQDDHVEVLKSFIEPSGGKLVRATKRHKRRKIRAASPWNMIEARTSALVSQQTHIVTFNSMHAQGYGPFLSITTRGLDFLDSLGDEFEPDELVRLSQIAPITGLSKRTLERYVHEGKLPAPDERGGKGHANKWYWSKIRPSLLRHCRRILPPHFPGSHIV